MESNEKTLILPSTLFKASLKECYAKNTRSLRKGLDDSPDSKDAR